MKKFKQEKNIIYTETPDFNERLYNFAKDNDLVYRLKSAENALIRYGTSIQKKFQLAYLISISEQLGKEKELEDYNDISNFKQILTSDDEDLYIQFKNNLNKEQEINPSFFLKFSGLVNSQDLKDKVEDVVKKYLERHNSYIKIKEISEFCNNDHLDYYHATQEVKGLHLFN